MSNAHAAAHHGAGDAAAPGQVLESLGVASLFGVAAFSQLSIAISQALLFICLVCWATLLVLRRDRLEVPLFFYPLLGYAAWTLVSAAVSPDSQPVCSPPPTR